LFSCRFVFLVAMRKSPAGAPSQSFRKSGSQPAAPASDGGNLPLLANIRKGLVTCPACPVGTFDNSPAIHRCGTRVLPSFASPVGTTDLVTHCSVAPTGLPATHPSTIPSVGNAGLFSSVPPGRKMRQFAADGLQSLLNLAAR
jgi:hypothetical protein